MITAIITAYREQRTIGEAIEALIEQDWPDAYELLVVCPDEETGRVVESYVERYIQVHYIRDAGKGKPAALNLAFERARGEICILTDGDVKVLPGAIDPLLAPFKNPRCGAVSGRPVSGSLRTTRLGYWSHLLTDAGAHTVRQRRVRQHAYIDCSGYLLAARCALLPQLPEHILADDAYISQAIWSQGYELAYAPEAKVQVLYPTNYHDWLLQKVRSTAGAADTAAQQNYIPSGPTLIRQSHDQPARMRSFTTEAREGMIPLLRYPRSGREWLWTFQLLGARLHLWWRVWLETKVRHRSYREIWQRVESTK